MSTPLGVTSLCLGPEGAVDVCPSPEGAMVLCPGPEDVMAAAVRTVVKVAWQCIQVLLVSPASVLVLWVSRPYVQGLRMLCHCVTVLRVLL